MENLYIQSVVTAQQAFEAMQAGKNVVCKEFCGEFDTLDHFPATVFFKPDYEFAIALQTKVLNDISFTIPVSLDEIEQDQEIYLVEPSSIKKVKFQNQDFAIRVIKNGFAQRDEHNAVNQLQAICKSLGIDADFEIEEIAAKPKRTTKKVNDKQIANIEKAAVLADEIETDSEKLYEKFVGQINTAESDDAVTEIRYTFQANSHLYEKHLHMLQLDCERRFGELSGEIAEEKEPADDETHTESNAVEVEHIDDGLDEMIPLVSKCDEIKILIQNANSDADLSNASNQILSNARHLSSDNLDVLQAEYAAREERLKIQKDLINRASNAQSATEANALIRYTQKWCEADREPVLSAINKRLVELAKPEIEQQSLAVRINSATTAFELEKLQPEIDALAPEIIERMQQIFDAKKKELAELPL